MNATLLKKRAAGLTLAKLRAAGAPVLIPTPAVSAAWVIDESLSTGTVYDCYNDTDVSNAMAASGPGAIIRLDGAATFGNVIMVGSGTAASWKTLRSIPGTGRPTVVASEGFYAGVSIYGSNVSYWQVGEFETYSTGTNEETFGAGINFEGGHHHRVVNNITHNAQQNGIKFWRTSNAQALGNLIYENAFYDTNQGTGISMYQNNADPAACVEDIVRGTRTYANVYEGNIIHSNFCKMSAVYGTEGNRYTDGGGMIIDDFNLDQATPDPHGVSTLRTLICNNIVYNCGGNAFVYYETDAGVDFCFNTTYDNGAHANYQDPRRTHTNEWAGYEHNPRQAGSNNRSGEIVYNAADDIEIRNNVCIAGDNPDTGWTGGKAVLTDWYASTITVDTNAFYSEENYWNDRVSSPGTNPILGVGWNIAPDLVDYANYDFTPLNGGNIDGTGDPLSYVTTDIYGVPRHASNPTPGAIEGSGTGPPDPPPSGDAPTFAAVSQSTAAANTGQTVSLVGHAAGDFATLVVWYRNNTGAISCNTPAGGWSLEGQVGPVSGDSPSAAIFTKTLDAGDISGGVTYVLTAATWNSGVCYSAADGASLDGSAQYYPGDGAASVWVSNGATGIPVSSITTTAADTMQVASAACYNKIDTMSTPAGYTVPAGGNNHTGSDPNGIWPHWSGYRIHATAGTKISGDVELGGVGAWAAAITFAVQG